MSGLDGTGVHVPVVLRHQVDVVEDEALEVVQLERLHEANVHDAGLVECVGAELRQTNSRHRERGQKGEDCTTFGSLTRNLID